MSKKGYQKGLPTILPLANPRPAIPAPRVPAPRSSSENDALAPVARAEPEPLAPAAQAEGLVPHPPQPVVVRSSSTRRKVALVLVGLVAVGIIDFFLVRALVDDGPDRSADLSDASSPSGSNTSYVMSEVLLNGDVVVRQRIRAVEPMQLLRLELPVAPGADSVSAQEVDVTADGDAVVGPDTLTDDFATFTFAPATDVRISYRLTGAVELSESVPGRALAAVTSLDVQYVPRPDRETRVVRAPEVLMLACSPSPEEPPAPCGESDGDGWRVKLIGQHVHDRVVAQLTLR